MRLSDSLRETAGFALVGLLLAAMTVAGVGAMALVDGTLGIPAAVAASAATGQILRRPVGHLIARLVPR